MNKYYEDILSTKECFDWEDSTNLIVESFGANNIVDEKAFANYINENTVRYLSKFAGYKAYIVIFKVFNRELSTIDHYKKLWKSDFVADIKEKLDNKSQVYFEHFNYRLYLGMGKIIDNVGFDYYKILNKYSKNAFVFFSINEYPIDNIKTVLFSKEKKTLEISYQEVCDYLCRNGDIVVRFGFDTRCGEIELIHKSTFPSLK